MFGSVSDLFDISTGSIEGAFEVGVEAITALLGQFAGSLGGPAA